MAKRSKKEGEEGEDEVEEEPRTVRKSNTGAATARGRREEEGEDAVLEEVDDAGPLLGPREERGEEGDSEVVPDEGESQSFLEDATYPRKYRVSRIPQL